MSMTAQSHIEEASRLTPLMADHDVIVCGAGPAGVAAALGAARTGASVLLLDCAGCLGGVWTAGSLTWIIDGGDKGGLMAELRTRLNERSPHIRSRIVGQGFPFDVEEMKVLLEELVLEAGVQVQLHTRVTAASCDTAGRLTHIFTESKSGRQAWGADCFVDCTGDGDLAALAGCGYDLGKPHSGECQPMSLVAMVYGADAAVIGDFLGGGLNGPKDRLYQEFARAGVKPSYGAPILLHLFDRVYSLIVNHEYGFSALDAADITRATLQARSEIYDLVQSLRKLGGPWEPFRLLKTAEQIGIREGRRIHGCYTVTENDLRQGARHEDAICRVTFGVDVHHTNPEQGSAMEEHDHRILPYDIPLRALIARDAKGLLMAGRCISGDFIAHSSYRVTGNAVPMGEAAGVLAALSAKEGCLPQQVPATAVMRQLNQTTSAVG